MTRRLMPTALASLALAPTASAQDCSLLDLNGCGCVNFFQFSLMLQLVNNGGPSIADYDNDGDTDGVDLAFFSANFNPCATTGQLATGLPELGSLELVARPVTEPDGRTAYEILAPLPSADAELISVTSAHVDNNGGAAFIDTSASGSGSPVYPIPASIYVGLNVPYDSYVTIGDRSGDTSPAIPLAINLNASAFANDGILDAPTGWVGDVTRVGTLNSPGLGGADGNTMNKVLITALVTDEAQGAFEFAFAHDGHLYIATSTIEIGAIPCPADTNQDGMLSPADFSAWVSAFNANTPACDQNDDGMCSPADFSAWVANYNAGC